MLLLFASPDKIDVAGGACTFDGMATDDADVDDVGIDEDVNTDDNNAGTIPPAVVPERFLSIKRRVLRGDDCVIWVINQ